MADIARPALAEVLAAITTRPVGHWRAEVASPAFVGVERISPRGVQWTVRLDPHRATTQTRHASLRQTEPAYEARRVGNTLTRVEVAPAHTITPAEAVEALATAELWPWEIGDERARWWCGVCGGSGALRYFTEHGPESDFCDTCAEDDAEATGGARKTGHTADPPSHAFLVAVASLGAPMLRRVTHTLAREIARAAGCPDARVVWRVMSREAIEEHHNQTRAEWWRRTREYGGAIDPTMPQAFSTEMNVARPPFWTETRWHSQCAARRAWPALRTLAVGDGETPQPTGVHLVALDATRIVLAVEAIGGPRG